MSKRPPLSVVIITKNEERNIEECLKSVHGWAEEIVVVDDESSDRTVKLCQAFTGNIFSRKMDNEGRHRNWAYAKATSEWVLSLDADERVTDELKKEIDTVLVAPEVNGFSIPRRNYIGSYWLRHGGQYPSAQLRLFRKSKFRYEEAGVHPRAFMEGPVPRLSADIIHYSYRDIAHYLSKLNGQTTLEAEKWLKDGRKMGLGKALWRTVDRFFRAYIGKKGHKDGFMGFVVALMSGLYQIVSYCKYYEMKNFPKQTASASVKANESCFSR